MLLYPLSAQIVAKMKLPAIEAVYLAARGHQDNLGRSKIAV